MLIGRAKDQELCLLVE